MSAPQQRQQQQQDPPVVPTTKTPEVLTATIFASQSVKQLRENEFTLDSREKICLKYPDCVLVLFYSENRESKNIAGIWAQAAAQVAGPVFAACNLLQERRVAEAFTAISMDKTHPFSWARIQQIPFILVYQGGWPKAFFNGDRTVETFIDYSLTLACVGGYEEREQRSGGMEAENRYLMTQAAAYTPQRTISTQYIGATGIRQYNAGIPPVIKGSQAERDLITQIQQQRAAAESPQQPPQVVGGVSIAGTQQSPPVTGRVPTAQSPTAPQGSIPIRGGESSPGTPIAYSFEPVEGVK